MPVNDAQLDHWNAYDEAIGAVDEQGIGDAMYSLAERLFPICRSITGDGVRDTLAILSEYVDLNVTEVPTGYQALDWTVPKEWNIRDAYIAGSNGRRVVDFNESNLHVVSYSTPVRTSLSLGDLKTHLHTRPDFPDAIPYRTSYYEDRWGFCLSQNQLDALTDDTYEVVIDSALDDGHLTYGDVVLDGTGDREILFSTYVCHPSMANNELSGPIVSAFLYQVVKSIPRRHNYRFVFAPETIGALVYLSKHGEHMRERLDAGYVITCAGDDGPYTYKRSRRGDSVGDRVAEHVLGHIAPEEKVIVHDFFPSGSDERQYCSPGFDLPVGSLMRSMYGTYPEYHTSLDDLSVISPVGLADTLKAYLRIVQLHEMNDRFINTQPYGEPQLSRRGLHPTLGAGPELSLSSRKIGYLLAYSDGEHDLIDIANLAGLPAWSFSAEIHSLLAEGLLRTSTQTE